MPETRTSTVSHSVPFWEPGSLPVKRKVKIYFHIFWTTGCIWGVRLLTSSFPPVFHPQFTAPSPLQSASTALSPENCFWKLARKLGRYSTYFLNKYSVFSHLQNPNIAGTEYGMQHLDVFKKVGLSRRISDFWKDFHSALSRSTRPHGGGSTHPKIIWRYHIWAG